MATKITVIGCISAPEYHRAKTIALFNKALIVLNTSFYIETDWEIVSHRHITSLELTIKNPKVMCFINNRYLGNDNDLHDWAVSTIKYSELNKQEFYIKKAQEEYITYLKSTEKKYILFEISISNHQNRNLVLELDAQTCPKTCENFCRISIGTEQLHYRNTNFHRVVTDTYIEGGLVSVGNQHRQNVSIYGGYFPDENYAYKHDKPGVLGMSKSGANKNGSAFYITLRALPYLDRRTVAFGRVIEGLDVIKDISSLADLTQRPTESCTISRSENYISYLETLFSASSEGSSNKLESADLFTLLTRREAIVKEIENTRNELNHQRNFRNLILSMLQKL